MTTTKDYERLARHASVWSCSAYDFDADRGERVNAAHAEYTNANEADHFIAHAVTQARPYAEAIRYAVNLVDFEDDVYGTVHDAEYGDELGRHTVDVWGGEEYEDDYRDDARS